MMPITRKSRLLPLARKRSGRQLRREKRKLYTSSSDYIAPTPSICLHNCTTRLDSPNKQQLQCLPSRASISATTPTMNPNTLEDPPPPLPYPTQEIQVRDLGITFKQANSRRKRIRLNPYIPQPSSLPSVYYTSVTFSSRRKGGIKASRRHILCTSQSDSYPESDIFSEGAGDDADFGYMDDGYTNGIDDVLATSKRKRTTAVSVC